MRITWLLEDFLHKIKQLPFVLGDPIVEIQLALQLWDPVRLISDEDKFIYSLSN